MSNTFAIWEQYLIYLRKSRQDDPRETVEEVLEKHETMLQDYAVREFGHRIPEKNIYREVVSGESISEREEIKEILVRITEPDIKGVLVVEPSRLSRGDLVDCGHLIDAFRYSKTEVVTPYMTYNLDNKMERKFFQDELLRGNDYLEYTKEILWRGRVAAAKRGCYATGGPAPFGYKKVKDGKDWILEVVPENAEIVKLMFDWYTKESITPGAIGRRLMAMGIKSPSGSDKWKPCSIRQMLANRHYLGLIVFNRYKEITFYEDGEKVKRRIVQKDEDVIIAKGKHPAIIDADVFEQASQMVARKPKTQAEKELRNPLATLLVCGKCGRAMPRDNSVGVASRFVCKSAPRCFKSEKVPVVIDAVLKTLEESELPALRLKVQNGEGNAVKIQQRLIDKLRTQLTELEEQEEKLYNFLETGVYTPEMFSRRHTAMVSKIETCRKDLEQAKLSMPKSVDYQERLETLERAIELLKDPTASADEQNKVLRAIISRIEYHGVPTGSVGYGVNSFTLKVVLSL